MTRLALRTLVLLAVAAALGIGAADASADSAVATVPVSGTSSSGGIFAGTMDINGFSIQDGALVALGTISGTLTDAAGNTAASVTDAPVAATVQQQGTSCTLVSLSIGAIDIEAIVVTVHVDPIGLNVGLTGLLGNLLCGLLGGGGTTPPLPATG